MTPIKHSAARRRTVSEEKHGVRKNFMTKHHPGFFRCCDNSEVCRRGFFLPNDDRFQSGQEILTAASASPADSVKPIHFNHDTIESGSYPGHNGASKGFYKYDNRQKKTKRTNSFQQLPIFFKKNISLIVLKATGGTLLPAVHQHRDRQEQGPNTPYHRRPTATARIIDLPFGYRWRTLGVLLLKPAALLYNRSFS